MTPPNVIVLLDVDGVLNPRLTGGKITLDEDRSALVAELAGLGDIVWATTYPGDVTWELGSRIGLPSSTRAIAFPSPLTPDRQPLAPTPKLHWVSRWLGRSIDGDDDRTAVVWIDDQLRHDAVAWADAQRRPTLLLSPDPRTGLAVAHVDAVREFVAGLPTHA